MPLIDQNGKELRLTRAPHYDVKIVASRREIVWNDGDEREENREDVYKPEVKESNVIVQTDPGEKPNIKERRSDQKESYKKREKDGKELNYHKKTSINKRNQAGKLLKSKSDDEIIRRKISNSFTLLSSTKSNNSTSSSRGKPSESEDTDRSYVNYNNPTELDKAVAKAMASVSSRNMDLMIMEMRKLDRDRDRVLIPTTVQTTLDKYHVPLKPECQQVLFDKFEDRTDFIGMINYEELVRFLEERRLQGGRREGNKVDNFILYETEHGKARYKRNRSWTNSMEERLVADIKNDVGSDSFSLSDLASRLHEKVSSPLLRSVLRALPTNISRKPVSGIMKASDLDNKGSHSIPVILDIMSKVLQ